MSDDNNISVVSEETGTMPPSELPLVERPDHVPEKFWDVDKGQVNQDALLKSYSELESKKGQPPVAEDPPAETTVTKALEKAGLDQSVFTKEIQDNGALSQNSYDQLENAGYDRGMVDQYLAGANVAAHQADLAAADISEIKGSVDNYEAMTSWAKANMPEDQLVTYNEMVSAGNKQQALAAVSWANSMYTAAEGSEPTLLNGGEGGISFDKFRSVAEVTSAMKDSRYGKDEAYTHDVMKKVGRSSVF